MSKAKRETFAKFLSEVKIATYGDLLILAHPDASVHYIDVTRPNDGIQPLMISLPWRSMPVAMTSVSTERG